MNLEEMTLEQLKATAYDLIASQEQTNRNLQAVNQMIAKKYEDAKSIGDKALDLASDVIKAKKK